MSRTEQRITWLSELIGHLLGQTTDKVIDTIEKEADDAVQQFLNGFTVQINGDKFYQVLFVFMIDEQLKLQNSPPPAELVTPLLIITRRTDQGVTLGQLIEEPEEISAENKDYFASQINLISTWNSPLQTLSMQLNLLYPALLPHMVEQELIFQSKKIAIQAQTTDRQLTSHYHLDVPKLDILNVAEAQQDIRTVQKIITAITGFNEVFNQALKKVYSLEPENDQPISEIELWRQKSAIIGTLYENMFTPDFKLIVQIIEKVQNDETKVFQQLRQEVSKCCLEARDNTRFLQTLERHFKLLARSPVNTLTDVITSLYSAIRMVWTISRYYNTEERLQPLLVRISHQINQRIKQNCKISEIFRQMSPQDAVMHLQTSKQVLQKWQNGYYETREKIQEENKEAQRWEFDKQQLFSQTEFLIKRLDDLLSFINKINEFAHIISADVQQATGDTSGVMAVRGQVQQLSDKLVEFGQRVYEEDRESDDTFEDLKVIFDRDVKRVEQESFQFLDVAFSKSKSLTRTLELVVRLQQTDQNGEHMLQKHMSTKVEEIITQYCIELQRCIDEFNEKQKDPPTGIDLPSVPGTLVWARSLFISVRDPHNIINQLVQRQPEYAKSEVVKKSEELYSKLKQALRTFEADRFLEWKNEADQTITKSLGSPLLGEKPILTIEDLRSNNKRPACDANTLMRIKELLLDNDEKADALPQTEKEVDMTNARFVSPSVSSLILKLSGYEMCVNFPTSLNKLIDEVKILDRLGFDVGETALNVALQKQKYEQHAEGLQNLIQMVNNSLQKFIEPQAIQDFLTRQVNTETPQLLIKKQVKETAKKIRQGFGPLNWNSLSVDAYLEEAKAEAARLESVCKNVLKTVEAINQNIKQIRNMRLVMTQQLLFQGTELPYAAKQNMNVSIDVSKVKKRGNESPTSLYLEALKQAELKAAAKNEAMYEELATMQLNEFLTRIDQFKEQKLTEALEKYDQLTQFFVKIQNFTGFTSKDDKCPELQNYYDFWAKNRITGAIQQMVQTALKDYYVLMKALTVGGQDIDKKFLKATYTPLFNLSTNLQGQIITSTPDVKTLGQFLQKHIQENIVTIAQPFVVWGEQSATMEQELTVKPSNEYTEIKRGYLYKYRVKNTEKPRESESTLGETVYVRSYHSKIADNQTVNDLWIDMQNKIMQTIRDLDLYMNAWSGYEQIWKLQRNATIQKLLQLEIDNHPSRRKSELTANELDQIVSFFTHAINYFKEGYNEKMFVLNHSLIKQKQSLLTTLTDDKIEQEEQEATNPFIKFVNEPMKLDENLLLGLPTGNSIQQYPPYRAIIGFCVLDSTSLVDSIIKECTLWRDAIYRLIIEKCRPRLLDIYREIEDEMNLVTQECSRPDQLGIFKQVLGTIVRVNQKGGQMELKINEVQSYYHILHGFEAIADIPDQLKKEQLKSYELNTTNDTLRDTLRCVDFGYSYPSVQQLLSISECQDVLCNDEVHALLSQAQIQSNNQTLSFLSSSSQKKQFKTVNCKVFNVEIVAADDLKRKFQALQILVGVVDSTLDGTKNKHSQTTVQQAKVFEANLQVFVTDFKLNGYNKPLDQLTSELQRAQADPTYVPRYEIIPVMNEASDILAAFTDKLKTLNSEKEDVLLAQKLFNLKQTDIQDLLQIEKSIQTQTHIFDLFLIIKEQFDDWSKIKFSVLETQKLELGCTQLRFQLKKLPEETTLVQSFDFVKQLIENYRDSIPLLTNLKSDALRPRHWKKIEEVCKTQFQSQEGFDLTLGQIIALNLKLYSEQITEIVNGAGKEQKIEQQLAEIQQKWTTTHLPLMKHHNAKGQDRCYILRSLDQIMAMVEESSVALQAMSSSKYVAYFANEVRAWEKNMSTVSDVLEAWIQCQRQWLYLEGIFASSDDLRVQLPDESKRFDRIDLAFVKLMGDVSKQNLSVLESCKATNRLKEIKELITQMENCQKALTNYLNSKRSKYQRFYFISDDELLSVLGRASDPLSVQPQIRKMFDNVATLEFPKVNNIVVGMNSPEGEQLMFNQQIKIEQGQAIEIWMTRIDLEMQESLRLAIKNGIYDFGHNYINQNRTKWVHKHLCQVCIVASEVYHTWDCEEAFRVMETGEGDAYNAMKKAHARKTTQINELVTEVRTELTKQARIKINTLLIIDIHNQTILDNLIKQNTTQASDFTYESQLRFYYSVKTDNLQIVQATPPYHPYLFEYQGLCGRLVASPLIDRLNMTLTTALNKRFFGNPAGPAGTGKTEGVKDLAKQLGRMCVVINCSEGVDVRAMGSTLSGACESGCWICFDEFNRIEPAVLSVISQQIKMILQGMSMCVAQGREVPNTKIQLEGREIVLRQTCGVFCTMNPGYQGRSELPDNLKALFRPVVMAKPNLPIICENMLFSEGFIQARVLSQKMTVLYKLASEQLSKQFHYDFGLRALKSVLVNAGKLKRQSPDEDEERVLMRALRDMNLPKFIFEDVPLFEGLIADLCPGIKIEEEKVDKKDQLLNMKSATEKALKEMNMEVIVDQVLKVQQFSDTLSSRHSVMLVGPTGGGKSVIRDAYCKANGLLGTPTNVTVINPKAQTVNELYGVLNLDTREWQDGLLSKTFRTLNDTEAAQNCQNIIYFDGDVDALWIENMNSVMDDNKLLTLPNNERIRMLDNCRLVFEVADLQYASPATVSRCGMCWVDTKNLGYAPRYNKWVREKFVLVEKESENKLQEAQHSMQQLFTKYLRPLLDYIFTGTRINASSGQTDQLSPLKLSMQITDLNMVNQFCNFFDDCISKTELEDPTFKKTILNEPSIAEALYIFCIMWSLGAVIEDSHRPDFDLYVKELSNLTFKQNVDANEQVSANQLPSGQIKATANGLGEQQTSTLYDFYFDLKKQCWISWSNFVKLYVPPADKRFSSVFVETLDTVRTSWILDTFAKQKRNVLFVGESGTAKTTIVKNYLNQLPADLYNTLGLNFSSRTGAFEAQNALENNLDRRSKDTLGPPGRKSLMFFVDNISMPVIDQYGTQQPISFLKLFIERKGIWDRSPKSLQWKKVIDVQTIGCLPPPGGSQNKLDPRFVSLFNVLGVQVPSDEAVTHIYASILSEHLRMSSFNFDSSSEDANWKAIEQFSVKLTQSTLRIFKEIQKVLSPTPSRFHYLFNLRDLSRVYEGMLMCSKDKFSKAGLLKLWRNEFSRVFCDRLISQDDRTLVEQKIQADITSLVTESTTTSSDDFTSCLENPLIFGDFREMTKLLENYENIYNDLEAELTTFRNYEELIQGEPICKIIKKEDGTQLIQKPAKMFEDDESPYRLVRILATAALDMYNQLAKQKAKENMQLVPLKNIVLFDDAIQHLLRLHRIIRTPKGCALLIGYGGSGRRSLTRLATFMAGYKIFEIQLSRNYGEEEFKADLQRLYKEYLAPPVNVDTQVVFLFTDQHVADESFLEFLNSILTTGIVPALFADDEREAFIRDVKEIALKNGCVDTKDAIWGYFVNSCRDRLHIVLSMSPVGDLLRKRCRSFPGLVSACTIDWYDSWSDEGLKVVAKTILYEQNKIQIVDENVFSDRPAEQVGDLKRQLQAQIVDFALQAHKGAVTLSDSFWTSNRRKNYVTPRNFVDFLQSYMSILNEKRIECNLDIKKFKGGLEKLQKANEDVAVMKVKLTEQKIVVEKKTMEVNKMVSELSVKTAEVQTLQTQAEQQGKDLAIKLETITRDATEAKAQLAEAQPVLDEAKEALNGITPGDIAQIRTMKTAKGVMEEVSAGIYALLKASTQTDWSLTLQMFSSSSFTSELFNFNLDLLKDKTVEFVAQVIKKYTAEDAKKAFGPLESMYTWLKNMVRYYEVYKIVAPKQRNVKIQEEKMENGKKELQRTNEMINKLTFELNNLKTELEKQQKEQYDLAEALARMKKQLEAAEQLITDLGSEKVRWAEEREKLAKINKNYVGDCLITAAFMNYAGGFTHDFREKLIQNLVKEVVDRKIPASASLTSQFRPEKLLIQDVEILRWGSEGLPSDELSVQNGCLVTRTTKWPLVIDPQLQAVRWIKEKEKENKLVVVSLNDSELMRQLEQAVMLGNPLLIENVGESLDPALTPILEKDIHVSQTGQKQIRIGAKDVDYDPKFQLYLTSKLYNPSFAPDVFSTLTVVNHCVTESGLEAQLLNAVVRVERPEQEQKRQQNVKQMSDSNTNLKTYEETLLRVLSNSTGPIVENYELIETLKTTKANVTKVQNLLKSLAITSKEIESIRSQYNLVAIRGRVCYFTMASLAQINNMYQYSLQAYMEIFMKSLQDAAMDTNVDVRITNIILQLTNNVYDYVCTSLFEKHKLMFSFLLATRIVQAEYPKNTLPTQELDFFVKGDFSLDECAVPNPHQWISAAGWKDLVKLNQILKSEQINQSDPQLFVGEMKANKEKLIAEVGKHQTITCDIFQDLLSDITNNDKEWKEFWDNERPELLNIPGKIGQNIFITDLQKLCILRCLRPDRVYIAVGRFISKVLSERYITPPVLNYDFIYNQSTRSTPVLFIITPGSDPLNEILRLATRKDFSQRFKFVALGQGQSPIAESYLKTGLSRGQWVLLMNCHLLPKWLKKLEKMIEPVMNTESLISQLSMTEGEDQEKANFEIQELNKKYNPAFRLFLTTEPSDNLPLSILQNSIKIVTEPPNSLRLNMLSTFSKISEDDMASCPSQYFRPLVYSLAFFHAAIQERQKYGKIGWNIAYDFNDSDFQISMDCLNTYLTKAHVSQELIPWQSIRYIIGEVNYGGRVMDEWDRRLVNTYLEEFFGDFVFDSHSKFSFYKSDEFDYSPVPAYQLDKQVNHQVAYKQVIEKLLNFSITKFKTGQNAEFVGEYLKHDNTIKKVYEDFFIQKIPLISSPEVFGLHTNAEIQYLESSTRQMWMNLAELQPRVQSAESISKEDYLINLCQTLKERIPDQFNLMQANKKFNSKGGIMPTEIVLLQELERFNALLVVMEENVDDLQKALKGEIGMSQELDAMATSFFIGQLPQKWKKYSPATLKNLSGWMSHLTGRAEQYKKWLATGEPAVIWLSGFHIPESYLTALVQTCSRIKKWPLDRSALFTQITNHQPNDIKQKLEFGCYIQGLFLEGAGWNSEKECLCLSKKKELMVSLPLIKVTPAEASRIKLRNQFKAPVYVTTNRTNAMGVGLVFGADVASFEHESHWVLQGVAICLNDN
ncbi:Dynein_heavy chain [Hexamita inflata]|uniref:Dynein heavy chain n=1 Tax=Hexamita inflata TaxID=28002 RepID=A0AA86TNM9_9EUKA|nr:Dynein heavy chain [Hexamita inflata]CAI9940064.1 Dynein heavy chain [Hexamita inflata]